MTRLSNLLVVLALIALTAIVYAPVRHFDFVQLDDPTYVTENPQVTSGLTREGASWAFTTGHAANWHPVTWLSHMLDVQLFGVNAGAHHLVNLALHIANTLLLFALLVVMTGARWRSALVAALFAVHPLHVESVAWVAERKDVLSTFFLMLTLGAYVRYVRSAQCAVRGAECSVQRATNRAADVSPGTAHGARRPAHRLWYLLVLLFFALGLMAKPMLVTLPVVMLLLDVWPLGRLCVGAGFDGNVFQRPGDGTVAPKARRVERSDGRCSQPERRERALPPQGAGGAPAAAVLSGSAVREPSRQASSPSGQSEADDAKVAGARNPARGGHCRSVQRRQDAKSLASCAAAGAIWPLIREKLPLFAMAAASSVATVIAQQRGGAVGELQRFPVGLRLENALVSLVAYLRSMVWPTDLTMLYSFPESIPAGDVVIAVLVLTAISLAVYLLARRHPYLAVGWLWYLVTLAPVAGIIQVGLQSRADRYTYVPLIGMFIIVAWGIEALLVRGGSRTPFGSRVKAPLAHGTKARGSFTVSGAVVVAVVVVLACAGAARAQVGYWKNNVTLFTHATMVTLGQDEYHAHMELGTTLGNQGRLDEATEHFAEAVRLQPKSDEARVNLGIAYGKASRREEALREFTEALRLNPGNEMARRAVDALRLP